MSRGIASAPHLAGRLWRELHAPPPDPDDLRWARSVLRPPEYSLLVRMTPRDVAHSLAVGRRMQGALRGDETDAHLWVSAALLHDVGKGDALLGVVGRVVATLLGWVGGRRWTAGWRTLPGRRGDVARYLDYPERGRTLLIDAGAAPPVAAWAAEHHSGESDWTVPVPVGRLLRSADL